MASLQNLKKLFTKEKDLMYYKTPGVAVAAMSWADMQNYGSFACLAMEAVLVGLGINQFEIRANSASDGSGTEAVIRQHALGTAPDAVGDMVVLECSAEELAQASSEAGVKLRYVSAWVKCANAGDKIALVYRLADPRFPADLLTADVIS